MCKECSQITRCGRQEARLQRALLSAQQNPTKRCLQAGGWLSQSHLLPSHQPALGKMLSQSHLLPQPVLEELPSGVQPGELSAFTLQCSAGSACSPVLPVRRILSLLSELGWKELQLVCRQLGYLRVCII